MNEILHIGENFYKDGKEVTIVNLGKMVINNEKYDCVVYDYVDREYGSTVVEKMSDFTASAFHTNLKNGDRIVEICMGKIITTYKVYGQEYETAHAISEIGGKMQFFAKIKPNGFVEPKLNVSNASKRRTEYLFVSSRIEKKLSVNNFINSCLSKIGNIKKTLSSGKFDYDKIDIAEIQDLAINLDKVKREMYKTIKILE